ncbi:hypothetical protein [Legionella nagasakiensis]|uniref:hypothetical protein n=1 Tax=Legionella nagasakiensis TaxID=535290 RepID=UPI001055AA49|nr:hypothetical protein [Legionella nagasakiensis]
MRHEELLVTLDGKPQGLSADAMQLFAALDAAELRAMAQYRSPKMNRTILHRLVLTEGACPEEIKEQFFRNLATLLSLMKPLLTEDDAKRLTHYVLGTANAPYVKELVRIGAEYGLEVFSNRAVIATYLDSQEYSHRAIRCRELGIVIPSREAIRQYSQKTSRTEVSVASTAAASSIVAQKEPEFLREMLYSVERKLARVEGERTTAVEALKRLQAQYAETQALLIQAQERLAKLDSLEGDLASEKEQREALHVQLQRTRVRLQQTKDREALLNENLDKANEKAASLEEELSQVVAEARELQQLNQQLTSERGESRRRERAVSMQLEHAQRAQTLFRQGMSALAMANGARPDISEADVVSAATGAVHEAAHSEVAQSPDRRPSHKRHAEQPSDALEAASRRAPTAAAASAAHSVSGIFATRKRTATPLALPGAPEFKRASGPN